MKTARDGQEITIRAEIAMQESFKLYGEMLTASGSEFDHVYGDTMTVHRTFAANRRPADDPTCRPFDIRKTGRQA